jgi:ubiquinone/menaquinone biosynthesis C-methylase UbiE
VPWLDGLRERRGLDVHLRSEPQMLQYRAIVDRIARDDPGRTLDWGCGFGQVSHLLREAGVDVVPFDYRPDSTEPGLEPLERYPGLTAHVSPDPVALPFPDDNFASALSCGVLEHVSDPDGSLDELRRVLRPGGTLYVYNLPNRWSYVERLARMLGLYYHGALPHDRVYTLRSATELLERHGFDVRHARRARMLPLAVSGRLATRAARPIWLASSVLERVPGLNLVATTLELVASARR